MQNRTTQIREGSTNNKRSVIIKKSLRKMEIIKRKKIEVKWSEVKCSEVKMTSSVQDITHPWLLIY
jgi:hypothetical protein